MFIAGAFGFGSSSGESGLFLSRNVGTNEFECNLVKGFLRKGGAVVILKGTKSKTPAAREGFVSCSGAFGFPSG